MTKIKIVVDSTVDLSKDLYEKYDMEVIPLNVSFGEETFKDGVTITRDQLYKDVEKFKSLPATSAPGPQAFEEVFRKWLDQGYEVIYVGHWCCYWWRFLGDRQCIRQHVNECCYMGSPRWS